MLLANTSGWDNGSHVLHFEMFVSFEVSKEEHYAFNQRGQSLLVDLRIGLVLGTGHVNPGPWRQELEKLYKIWLFGTLEIILCLLRTRRENRVSYKYTNCTEYRVCTESNCANTQVCAGKTLNRAVATETWTSRRCRSDSKYLITLL